MTPDTLKTRMTVLHRIEKIAAIFLVFFGMLLLVNFVLTKNQDPLNTPVMQKLLSRLSENPEDQALREQVRSLDLLARKAFFTRQWQIRTGGSLLLVAAIIWLLAMKGKAILSQDMPDPALLGRAGKSDQKKSGQVLVYAGLIFVALAVCAGFFSHSELQKNPLPIQVKMIEPEMAIEESATKVAQPMAEPSVTTPPIAAATAVMEKAAKPTPMAITTLKQDVEHNWPAFRGPYSNGKAFYTNAPTMWDGANGKNIKWKVALPTPGFNSPIVWGEHLFLSGGDASKREIVCLQTNDGAVRWRTTVPSGAVKLPQVSKDTGFAASTMTTDGERVFAVFATGDLVGVDFNGQIIWSKNLGLPDNHYGHSSSLITWQNLLFVQYDNGNGGRLLALNSSSGAVVWDISREVQIAWASPILARMQNSVQIILNANPIVAGYDPLTGKELWSHESVTGEVAPSPAFADGRVFVANEYSRLVAIDIRPPAKLLWETDEDLPEVSSPLATDQLLFIGTSGGIVDCRNALTGEKFWTQEYDKGFYASPILVGDRIYLMDNDGLMHVFKCAPKYELISDNPLGEPSTCTPAFLNGRIYIRGEKHLYGIAE
jgi:outer membrane protein assembly factor BamB